VRIEWKLLAWKVLEDGEGICACDEKEGWKLLSARERRDSGGLRCASSSDEDQQGDAVGLEVVRVQDSEAVGVAVQRMRVCLVSSASSQERCLRNLEGKCGRIANESPVVRLVPRVLDHRSPPIIGSEPEKRLMVCSAPMEGRRAPAERGLAWLVGTWKSYVVSSIVCGVECGKEEWRREDEGAKWGKGQYRKGHSGQNSVKNSSRSKSSLIFFKNRFGWGSKWFDFARSPLERAWIGHLKVSSINVVRGGW